MTAAEKTVRHEPGDGAGLRDRSDRHERQRRLALEIAGLGTWDCTPGAAAMVLDEQARALLGLAPGARTDVALDEALSRLHEEDRTAAQAALLAALQPGGPAPFDAQFRVLTGDGQVRWIHARGEKVLDPDDGAPGLTGVIADITERKAGEEARLQIARELNHRVKNLFAIANGLVSMTARSAGTPKEMAEALRGRLGALSRAHELARPAFGVSEHAGQATTLGRLIASILDPYAQTGHGQRLSLDGPAVNLGANAVTSLALVLHELATNAAKYGSLSSPDGQLAIAWRAEDGAVAITWAEAGGPAVAAAPSAQGFGSQLSRKSITGQLGGTLDHDWRPEGLEVRITLPLDRISI